jgi:ATP-dependent helicase/nuclease subunit A
VSRLFAVPPALRERQAEASNPKTSAWASANAGSGKTHVLTQRVVRLLLAGTPPAQILCLAYTKAAAANMAERIFAKLAQWTSLSDEALTEAIVECGEPAPGPRELAFARQLFARTIETPGGLKIQTLHAFAERLLRLFPLEANVPAHFKVIDENEARLLMLEARDRALAALSAAQESMAKLDLVARECGAHAFDDLLKETLSRAEALGAHNDAPSFAAALSGLFGLGPEETTANLQARMLGGELERMRRETWARDLDRGKIRDQEFAARLLAANREDQPEVRIEALLDAFFAKAKDGKPGRGEPRGGEKGNLITDDLRGKFPKLDDDLRREQDRLADLRERRRATLALERSGALFVVATAILSTYARMKAARGALDFDDLIARALALLTRSSAAWVLHKLDYGLDHLLLDEAQDASRSQWDILAALTAEFFAGAGARGANRTVFAVGDEKQSIFGFRGAAPEMLAEMKRLFAKRHSDAERPFADVQLTFSFRSAQTILDAVDMTFRSEAAWRGVATPGEPPPPHLAVRRELKGVVELWPPIAPVPAPEPEDWRVPLDQASTSDPPVLLAQRIASVIKEWRSPDSRERVVDPGTGEVRPIRESDVLILVPSRNAFFEAMVRALKAAGLKAAGADRLTLKDHIAVMDLIAAGRAALLPDDDLTLASVLKSPLIGIDEEALRELVAKRRGSLAGAIAASDDLFAAQAARRLAAWRKRARALSPFSFYALLLGEDGGRKALVGRLGPEASDPIDEFLTLALAHERREAPSLNNFLAEVEAADAEIKRDMEVETEGVRVLTVHASKGLESPIVFLPDTCSAPNGRQDPKLMRLSQPKSDDAPAFAWVKAASLDASALADARAEAREAAAGEYRRLLYVAMTRAGQRLIVAGYDGKNARPENCWYNLIHAGLAESLLEAPAPFAGAGKILRFGESLRARDGAEMPHNRRDKPPPDWLFRQAAPETTAAPLSPSRLDGRGKGDRERVEEGRLAHAFLQLLPNVAPERRERAARDYLDSMSGGLAEPARAALAARVLAAIKAPELSRLFGPGSRAEVSLTGLLPRPGRPSLPYNGRLDRLAATPDGIWIVDFKLGSKPDVPAPTHVAQLALYRAALRPLYPGREIRAGLVYLGGPTLAPVAGEELEAALDALSAPP